jgi:hypothetical protein
VLVVQGDHDPFGTAAEFPDGAPVVTVPGDHALRGRAAAEAAGTVVAWLRGIVAPAAVLPPT